MSLEEDLERFVRLIAARLLSIDGPLQDRRGILYRCGDHSFRSYHAAQRYRDRHNQAIHAAAIAGAKAERPVNTGCPCQANLLPKSHLLVGDPLMNPEIVDTIQAAQTAVTRLVTVCQKAGSLYPLHPKTVAHVSRTSKWLLNALRALDRAFDLDLRNPA